MIEAGPSTSRELRSSSHRGDDAVATLADPRWRALVERQDRPNPTLLGGWLQALALRQLGEPLVITVAAGEELVAAGAFEVRTTLGGRIAVASWLGGQFQPFSPDILAVDDEAAVALVDALLGQVDLVKTIALEAGRLAQAARRVAPWASIARAPSGTFVATLPLSTRTNLLRAVARDERRANREGVDVDVRVATEAEAVEQALERLFRLHRDRWAGRPDENGAFSTTASTRAFHRNAVRGLAEEGHVSIVEVVENGELVGSILGLLAGRGGLAYAMAMRRGRGLPSPGLRTLVALTEQLHADGGRVLDLGGGSLDPTSPKGRLAPVADPFATVLVASSRPRQRLTQLALRGRIALRSNRG